MHRCRVKHQEKLYYTETGERRRRGTEEAGVEKGSVGEKHEWGGGGKETRSMRGQDVGASEDL